MNAGENGRSNDVFAAILRRFPRENLKKKTVTPAAANALEGRAGEQGTSVGGGGRTHRQ